MCRYFLHLCMWISPVFTCERELLCATTAAPPWCAPLLKLNGVVSGLAHHLHLADESLWWSLIFGDMYWCAHTLRREGWGEALGCGRTFTALTQPNTAIDLWNGNAFCTRPTAQQSQRSGAVTAQFILAIEYVAQRHFRLLLQGLDL